MKTGWSHGGGFVVGNSCGTFDLCLHLHLHLQAVSAVAITFAFACALGVYRSACICRLHSRLHSCCHAARFAMALHLGCACVCMLCPIRVLEGDVEGSAFALAPTCCGVRGQMLVSTSTLVSACDCIAWNCIATSCVALNVVPMHLLALQLRNGCRRLAK